MYEIWCKILNQFCFSPYFNRKVSGNDKNEEPQQADFVGAFHLQIVIVFLCTKG